MGAAASAGQPAADTRLGLEECKALAGTEWRDEYEAAFKERCSAEDTVASEAAREYHRRAVFFGKLQGFLAMKSELDAARAGVEGQPAAHDELPRSQRRSPRRSCPRPAPC